MIDQIQLKPLSRANEGNLVHLGSPCHFESIVFGILVPELFFLLKSDKHRHWQSGIISYQQWHEL